MPARKQKAEGPPRRTERIVTAREVIDDPDVRALINAADRYLDALGYTYHGMTHVGRVATRAGMILDDLGISEESPRDSELAQIAGVSRTTGAGCCSAAACCSASCC